MLWAALGAALLLSCQTKAPATAPAKLAPTVVFPDGWTVTVDLALTPEQQERGLMFVRDLPADKGMLFLFDSDAQRPFWMKDCFISLDLVWLDADFRVVDISRDVPPCAADPCPNYFPSRPIRNVLEVRGGLCAEHGLKIGDGLTVLGLPSGAGASGGGAPQ